MDNRVDYAVWQQCQTHEASLQQLSQQHAQELQLAVSPLVCINSCQNQTLLIGQDSIGLSGISHNPSLPAFLSNSCHNAAMRAMSAAVYLTYCTCSMQMLLVLLSEHGFNACYACCL